MKKILFVAFLLLSGCNKNLVSPKNNLIVNNKNISNINWQIKSVVTKRGTNNPDEIVPSNSMSVIDTGYIIQGIICLNEDSSVTIKNNTSKYYLNSLSSYKWALEDTNFIRFKRFDTHGQIIQSLGYNVRFNTSDQMQWYIQSVGIESGIQSIEIITFYN